MLCPTLVLKVTIWIRGLVALDSFNRCLFSNTKFYLHTSLDQFPINIHLHACGPQWSTGPRGILIWCFKAGECGGGRGGFVLWLGKTAGIFEVVAAVSQGSMVCCISSCGSQVVVQLTVIFDSLLHLDWVTWGPVQTLYPSSTFWHVPSIYFTVNSSSLWNTWLGPSGFSTGLCRLQRSPGSKFLSPLMPTLPFPNPPKTGIVK